MNTASEPVILELLGHDAEMHDALTHGEVPFDETLLRLFQLRQSNADFWLDLPIVQRNLGQFHHVFNLALRLADVPAAELIGAFDPRPLTRLTEVFAAFVGRLRKMVHGTRVRVRTDDERLSTLLGHVQNQATAENEPELLRLLGLLTEGAYIGPRTFHLDLSNGCNENCAYCWFHSPSARDRTDADQLGPDWKRQMLSLKDAKNLIDDLEALGVREDVLLTGKGEPLTHPDCLTLVDYIKQKGLHLTLFSNGLLLSPANLERLHAAGLDLLYVSLSAVSDRTYEALHPGHPSSELTKIRTWLEHLRRLKEQTGRQLPRVVMVDVINRLNAAEVAEFARWSASVGAEYLRYQLIHVQYYNRHLMLGPEELQQVRSGLEEAQTVARDHGMEVMQNLRLQLDTLDPPTGAWGRNSLPDEGCLVGWYFSRTWADGTVSFCCSPKPIGNIRHRRFRDLWNEADYARYRWAAKRLEQSGEVTCADGTPLLNCHCYGCPNYEGLAEARRGLERYDLTRWL